MDVVDKLIKRGRLLSRNAESDIYLCRYLGLDVVVKKRVVKPYRAPDLDLKIRSSRTLRESNILFICRERGLTVPPLIYASLNSTALIYKYIEGTPISNVILSGKPGVVKYVLREVGKIIGLLHSIGIVHGDPHPANFILTRETKVYVIDFGLAYFSDSIKEQVFDLDVMFRALNSLVPDKVDEFFRLFIEGYRSSYNNSDEVIRLHSDVLKMGRYHERNR